jgi:hypothetical protein
VVSSAIPAVTSAFSGGGTVVEILPGDPRRPCSGEGSPYQLSLANTRGSCCRHFAAQRVDTGRHKTSPAVTNTPYLA